MARDLYLVAPSDADTISFPGRLAEVLDAVPAAALLLVQADRSDGDYLAFAKAVAPIAQSHDCAVLLENRPDLVEETGADGVHMTGSLNAFREAVRQLKPDGIVGAGNIHSHHAAMEKGEAGADYLFFGDPETGTAPQDVELAAWWAKTFEIPSVLFEPDADALASADVEFVALGRAVWTAQPSALSELLTRSGVAV